ncbi:HepT-like ribonuclease domain-containing protein [Acidovorax sp. GW101-3H11]|uniref:HepT-like ribonuclease domain-containing protein n=1 Tax=Acidovorax sp. GW101-3H11 TaxID=1813946 RepID=UPI0009ECED57|nr:HepT-like ribonuclease domain-containing protein [Acidovorax sp. GW101-3H11]
MPDIPWRKVIGLRNILAHGYEQVAHEILFKTIADDLPALETAVLRALADA